MQKTSGLQKLTNKVLKNAKLPKDNSKDYFDDLFKLNRTNAKEVLQFKNKFNNRVPQQDRKKILEDNMCDIQVDKCVQKYFAAGKSSVHEVFQGKFNKSREEILQLESDGNWLRAAEAWEEVREPVGMSEQESWPLMIER